MFGFQGSLADHGAPDRALQLANARALGNSLLILLLVPWGLDFLFYCGAPGQGFPCTAVKGPLVTDKSQIAWSLGLISAILAITPLYTITMSSVIHHCPKEA